jgi:nucleotide-binding universal stress UspA family protein
VHALNLRHSGVLYQDLLNLSKPKIEEQKKLLEEAGFRVHVEMPVGVPYDEINRLAAEHKVSLIVVYSTADSLLGDVFRGAVAYEVVNKATLPVLVMKARMSEHRVELVCPNLLVNILHPTDFSHVAKRSFRYVERLVEAGCAQVTLMHVQEKPRIEPHLVDRLEEFNRKDVERLEKMRDRLLQLGADKVLIELPYGYATAEILNQAREELHSLIVMGSQGRGFIGEIFLGSVSHQVVRKAALPVLLVPAERAR